MNAINIEKEMYDLIDSYTHGKLEKVELISCVKRMFYKLLNLQNYPIEAVKMHYFMTSIIDNEDLSDSQYFELISYLYDVIYGKRNYKCSFMFRLAHSAACENIQMLDDIITKLTCGGTIDLEDKEFLCRVTATDDVQICTIADLLYNKTLNFLKLCCFNITEPGTVTLSKTLFIDDEVECVDVILHLIKNYIKCLRAEQSFVVCVEYNSGVISIGIN